MKQKIVIILLLVLSLLSTNAYADKIIIAIDENYKPYMYASNNQARGLYTQLISSIFKGINYTTEIKPLSWKRALQYGKLGKMGIGGIYLNSERLKIFDYSDPIYKEKLCIFVLKGKKFKFFKLKDLRNKKIGINYGWSYGEDFDTARKKYKLNTFESRNNLINFDKLIRKQLDCVIADELSAEIIINNHNFHNKVEKIKKPLTINNAYLVFSKKSRKKALLYKFNNQLALMKKNRSFDQIVKDFYKSVKKDK